MKKLYGVGHHSPVTVYDNLVKFSKLKLKKNIRILNITGKSKIPDNLLKTKYKDVGILLIPSLADFLKVYSQLNKMDNIVVILFDAPHLLAEFDMLEFWDVLPSQLSFAFMLKGLDWVTIKHKLMRVFKSESKPIKISRTRVDIIPNIINTLQSSSFLDPYNYIRYQILNQDTRPTYMKLVVDFVFGEIKRDDFESQLRDILPKKGKSLQYIEMMLKHIDSKSGESLLKAGSVVLEAMENQKNPNYRDLASEFGVNLYTLKYLTANYREIYKKQVYNNLPKDLADVRDHYVSSHSKYKDVAGSRNFS